LSVGYYLTTLSEVLNEVGTLSNFPLQSFSKHLAKQVQLGKALIENDSLREQMSEAQRRERKPEAAMQIVSLLERLVSHE